MDATPLEQIVMNDRRPTHLRSPRASCALAVGLWLGCVVLATLAPSRGAQALDDNAVANQLGTSILDWTRTYNVPGAALAIMKDGQLVGSYGYGTMDPAQPAHLGSLSKAITAVCVSRLVDQGLLSFNQTLGSAIPAAFRRYG
jgi:CubicO group peptidase (beta-lactamase class C family)